MQVKSKLIYLDTNIWNRLMDQNVSPQKLLSDLTSKDADLALSGQTVYELARTFLSSVPTASARARDLFQYLENYVDAGIPCAHDNMRVLHGEVDAMHTGASEVVTFYGPTEYAGLRSEVKKLSQGIFDKLAEDSRIAKGIVRTDLYFNWRCANRGSTPGDLADDLYHVLNASYCAIYATAEPRQAVYG